MTDSDHSRRCFRRGEYLGEISALCFLHLPSHISSLPLLLAGTGSQILVYDLVSGKIIRSFQVFEGIRVHGIALDNFDNRSLDFRIAVFGERRVKLFILEIGQKEEPVLNVELSVIFSLPRFGHWILDVSFLKDGLTSSEDSCYLAIGCSDNSVYFWNFLEQSMFSSVKSAEKCLLYSMRMSGTEIESLFIASGTIMNEILVWKVVLQNHTAFVESPANRNGECITNNLDLLPCPTYTDALISRLVGHEGSIFRISWFSNGKKLVSVSDDRSARIWEVHAEKEVSSKTMVDTSSYSAGPTLFGHNARIWDCCIDDSVIITAGEDCTCRVWDHHGRELKEIKEHIGRGVWRCLYDPSSSLLVTAGFDAAIKVHQVCTSRKGLEVQTVASDDFSDRKEVFSLTIPKSSAQAGLTDSKSEYVRCLHFAREDSLYVATNNGYLYHISLSYDGSVKWTELARVTDKAPIICMDLISKRSDFGGGFEDWVAIGDGKGSMAIIQVAGTDGSLKVEFSLTWPAEKERHLLGTFWCKSLENRFIYTADPGGRLKLWKLCRSLTCDSLINSGSYDVFLVAEYASCFGMRIMCVDASFDEEVLVCGDIRGNLLLYSLPSDLLCGTSVAAEVRASPMNYFKGAHGVSSVSSVLISSLPSHEVEICSTGADGCICYFKHDRDLLNFEFTGMKQVKELSLIRTVITTADHSAAGNYAVGFASSNFIIWNSSAGTKVLQIACGGWRRPYSYHVGRLPEMMNCFSFIKDDVIHIHRQWMLDDDRTIYPQNLHLQSHGREIHSLCFISGFSSSSSYENRGLNSESSWIATGCEDGTVRLSRYEQGMQNWSSSQHLGEHVGGSAVRSICYVSKMHIFNPDSAAISNDANGDDVSEDKNPYILVSVGAKRVVTAWKRIIRTTKQKLDSVCKRENVLNGSSAETVSSLSFQWLSTDMPLRSNGYVKKKNGKESLETADLTTNSLDALSVEPLSSNDTNVESNLLLEDSIENDWRYLDVTAFLVKEAGSRISICFVIVACSDATVTLRALVLPSRLWFDVATLAPLPSPVLALQHVVIPNLHPSKGEKQIGNHFLAITGSTDGSIAVWDLTECVENFMYHMSGLQMENAIEFQKRPRTGRGSQGGRSWKSIYSHNAKKNPGDVNLREKTSNCKHDGTSEMLNSEKYEQAPLQNANPVESVLERKKDDPSPETVLLEAVHVLGHVHQSGVNCLYVSDVEQSESGFSFDVVSGGDDQAINCFRCNLKRNRLRENMQNETVKIHYTIPGMAVNNGNRHRLIQNYQMQFSCTDKIGSAHSSAVKGVWTDGKWVFSVGLDQRVRCWSLSRSKLTEYAHLVVSVPEPEALDVKNRGRNRYQIAVAGRGMQMIEFCPTNEMSSLS